MRAAYGGHVAVIRSLIKAGAPVNARDMDGASALLWAAERGMTESVAALLKQGADIELGNNEGWTAAVCHRPIMRAAMDTRRSSTFWKTQNKLCSPEEVRPGTGREAGLDHRAQRNPGRPLPQSPRISLRSIRATNSFRAFQKLDDLLVSMAARLV